MASQRSVIWSRRTLRPLFWLLSVVFFVGPWPAVDRPYLISNEHQTALTRIEQTVPEGDLGRMMVGIAQASLTPHRPTPVAGFIGQTAEPYRGINSVCQAKALTLRVGEHTVTILAVDLLLVTDHLSRAILSRTGLSRDQIYFTASHTHSGPGAWGNHPLERLVAGTFDPDEFERLANRLASVVLQSRMNYESVDVAFVQTDVIGMQRNRITPSNPTNDLASAWVFRASDSPDRIIAAFAVFGAHATISHPIPSKLGGDYPVAFADELARLTGSGMVLFAAGSVGDASPIRIPAGTQQQSVEAYGKLLATELARAISSAQFTNNTQLENLFLPVNLPPVQVPCGWVSLRFSPCISWWITKRMTGLHTLRIGPAVLAGFPGDFTGQLARTITCDIPVVTTSFNGDYKGYLVSAKTFYDQPCYETRWMNFFGAHLGDSLTDLARRCVLKILSQRH